MNDRQPNILWICTDQQRYDTLNCYGNEFVNTPNLDRLAEMGVLFENAYVQSPVCSPSRASFLTGRYPRTTRLRQNGQSIPEDEVLVTKTLADEGYVCGLSGKLHLSACFPSITKSTERRVADGYANFHWSHHPRWDWAAAEYNQWLLEQGLEFSTSPTEHSKYVRYGMSEEYHQTKWCVDKAITFMKSASRREQPWLFSVNMFDPHAPFDPPKEYLNRYLTNLDEIPLPNYVEGELEHKPKVQTEGYDKVHNNRKVYPFDAMTDTDHRMLKASYWAMVDLIDKQVGRLLTTLEELGELENTVIIFMSDHGEMLGDHGMYLKGPFFYEPAVHVPLIIAWPGVIQGNVRSKALVEMVDLAPTILDFVQIQPSKGIQGKSLANLLRGVTPLDEHRTSVYCEFYNGMPWHGETSYFSTMVFDGRYKLVRMHDSNEGELYDLHKDKHENKNLWNDPSYSQIKIKMLEIMCDRMAETVDPLPPRLAQW